MTFKRIYVTGSLSPLYAYLEDRYARQRTIEFLHNLQELSRTRFPEPLTLLQYYQHEIEVDPVNLQLHRKKGLQIRTEFLWNSGDDEMIFLSFSNSNNMEQELGVFLTLAEELNTKPLPIREPKLLTYWFVPNRTESTIARSRIVRAPVSEVLATCNKLLAPRPAK